MGPRLQCSPSMFNPRFSAMFTCSCWNADACVLRRYDDLSMRQLITSSESSFVLCALPTLTGLDRVFGESSLLAVVVGDVYVKVTV